MCTAVRALLLLLLPVSARVPSRCRCRPPQTQLGRPGWKCEPRNFPLPSSAAESPPHAKPSPRSPPGLRDAHVGRRPSGEIWGETLASHSREFLMPLHEWPQWWGRCHPRCVSDPKPHQHPPLELVCSGVYPHVAQFCHLSTGTRVKDFSFPCKKVWHSCLQLWEAKPCLS